MIQVDNHLFFADGKWRYEGSTECYRWKWENGELWWAPTDDETKACWIPWSEHRGHANLQRIRNATMTLTMEASLLRDSNDD